MLQLTKQLHSQMKSASELQQYERAAEIRDTLNRLDSLQTKQKMEYVKNQDEEYFGIKTQNQKAIIMTFRQIQGVIRDSDKFSFDLVGDNTFSNFLYQYYTTHQIPKNIIVNELPKNIKILEKIFSKKAGFQVQINSPKGSKRKAMIELILRNIEMLTNQDIEPGLVELQKLLNINEIPKIIECFDISNQGIDYAVGAMSRFVNGKPEKSG